MNHWTVLGLILIVAGFFMPAFTVFGWSTPDSVPTGAYLSGTTLYMSLFSFFVNDLRGLESDFGGPGFSSSSALGVIERSAFLTKYVPFVLIGAGIVLIIHGHGKK